MVTPDELRRTRRVVGAAVPPMPRRAWLLLSACVGLRVRFKHEHTP